MKQEKKETTYLREFYTLEQLSKDTNFNIQTLRAYIRNGDLKASKIGTRYIITRDSFNSLLKKTEIKK